MKQTAEMSGMRQVGRGFILFIDTETAMSGRRLTKAYVDRKNNTYVQVNGQLEPLTAAHGYLAID